MILSILNKVNHSFNAPKIEGVTHLFLSSKIHHFIASKLYILRSLVATKQHQPKTMPENMDAFEKTVSSIDNPHSREKVDMENPPELEPPSQILKKVDDTEEGSEPSTTTTTDAAELEMKPVVSDNGSIFGYLSIPPIVCLFIQYIMYIIIYIEEHVIELISMPYMVDDEHEPPTRPLSQTILLHIHAFGAIGLMGFMFFQQLSGLLLTLDTQKRENFLRRGHRANGRFVAFIWVFLIVSGFAMVPGLGSVEKHDQRNKAFLTAAAGGSAGIAMLINLYVGMRAVIPKGGDAEKKDYILHKGSMFFAFVMVAYLTGPGALSINLATWIKGCTLSYTAQFFLFAMAYTLIAGSSYLAGLRWGGPGFRRPFVQYNFAFIFAWTVTWWIGCIITSMSHVYPEIEGRCNLF